MTGPNTPPPPGGPGRAYAPPLTEEQRLWHYTHQNRRVDHYRPGLTPRQRRRLEKKARRAVLGR